MFSLKTTITCVIYWCGSISQTETGLSVQTGTLLRRQCYQQKEQVTAQAVAFDNHKTAGYTS